MEYKVKNIVDAFLEKEFNLLIQGCNCFCGFGRGLAEEILNRIPEAYHEADALTKEGCKNKLGTYSSYQMNEKQFVINAYTQYHWIKKKNNEPKVKNGRGFVLANYEAIRLSLRQTANDFQGYSIGLPKIGGGWANGDWNIISNIIEEELINKGFSVTIYVIDKNEIPKK